MTNKSKSDWRLLRDFIKKRRREPWKNPGYVFYFLIVIVLVGTFGVLKELIEMKWCWSCDFDTEKVKNFCFNLSSTGLSLVTASVIDLIFISRKTVEKETGSEKYKDHQFESIKRSIRIFGLSCLIVSFVGWIIINTLIENNFIKIGLSILSLLFSYLIWWISNVQNKILSNGFNPFGPLGTEDPNNTTPSSTPSEKPEENLNGNISTFNTK